MGREGRKKSELAGVGDVLGSAMAGFEQLRARQGAPSPVAPTEPRREPSPASPPQRRGPPPEPSHTRFDHGLAEFPAFRFGRRRRSSSDLITFTDTIKGLGGKELVRRWTVHPSRFGYGGATTHALLFDLHQVWKEQGFRGTRIYYGTLSSLYRRQHPGKYPAAIDYARLRRDLGILCGYQFDCENAFWDPVTQTYGSMRDWSLFTGWYDAHHRGTHALQDELPFGFIEVSETFARIARERGFFVTGFESPWFHSLRPSEQRLALYLSKMFASQALHRRYEDDLYDALPIEGTSLPKKRQTLRETAAGLLEKGYPGLESFQLERGATGRFVATFRRKAAVRQDYPVQAPPLQRLDDTTRLLIEDVLAETNDPGSVGFYLLAVRALGHESMRYALADLRSEARQKTIHNKGAWLTTKLMAMAKERGVRIARHEGKNLRGPPCRS